MPETIGARDADVNGLRPSTGISIARLTAFVEGIGRRPTGRRVLVVDDVEDTREMYAAYLRFAGFAVDVAGDGTEALEKVFRQPPDVVVLDLTMPGLDGWETCRRLKGSPSTRHVVIVAVSAHALGDAEKRARTAGCDVYLAKPCLPEDVLAEITRLLG